MLPSRIPLFAYVPWSSSLRNVPCFFYRIPYNKELTILSRQCGFFGYQYSKRWKTTNENQSSVSEVKEPENTQLTLGEKVKQTTKDVSYLGVIIAGIGVTGVMFYTVLKELFSGQSPNSIYTDALKLCRSDPRIVDALGNPIKGYGELSSRGRRRHVSHLKYEKDGINYMRMKFYVEGIRKKGTVQLEVKEGKERKYEYRYLFVDVDGFPPSTIILKDNRHIDERYTKIDF